MNPKTKTAVVGIPDARPDQALDPVRRLRHCPLADGPPRKGSAVERATKTVPSGTRSTLYGRKREAERSLHNRRSIVINWTKVGRYEILWVFTVGLITDSPLSDCDLISDHTLILPRGARSREGCQTSARERQDLCNPMEDTKAIGFCKWELQ